MNITQIKVAALIEKAKEYIDSTEGCAEGYPSVTLIVEDIPMNEMEEIAKETNEEMKYNPTFKCMSFIVLSWDTRYAITVSYHSIPVKAKVVYE